MSTLESLSLPSITEDARLQLGAEGTVVAHAYTPSDVESWAQRAAQTANALFGWDEKAVIDTVTPHYEALQPVAAKHDDIRPIIGLKVGALIGNQIFTPSHLLQAHDQLGVPETFVWHNMCNGHPATWWNQRSPEGMESSLSNTAIQGLLVVGRLEAIMADWDIQQRLLSKTIKAGDTATTAIEGMTPTDWLWLDADALVHKDDDEISRPDTQTSTRFIQHERDITDDLDKGYGYGLCASVVDGQARLDGSSGYRNPNCGFRVVMGQKQPLA